VSLVSIEEGFRDALHNAGLELEAAHEALMKQPWISLKGRQLTKAVLLRVGAFYALQEHAKRTLGTGAIGSGSSFFADSVYLYLKAVLASRQSVATVRSEQPVKGRGGIIKPDISVWCGNTCVAAIECKTQMGWTRGQWEQNFIARQEILSGQEPPAEVFLVSLTNRGGPKALENSELLGSRYFILARDWPTNKSETEIEPLIWTPIEGLFKRVVGLARPPGSSRA
jgi:hypothetical protein